MLILYSYFHTNEIIINNTNIIAVAHWKKDALYASFFSTNKIFRTDEYVTDERSTPVKAADWKGKFLENTTQP